MKKKTKRSIVAFGEFRGLEGAPKRMRGWIGGTRTEFVRVLMAKGIAHTADDYGLLCAWRNKKRNAWTCEFHRHYAIHGQLHATSQRQIKAWLKKWWPCMSENVLPKESANE